MILSFLVRSSHTLASRSAALQGDAADANNEMYLHAEVLRAVL